MKEQTTDNQVNNRIFLKWLAHHNPKRKDFHDHVLYLFNYAICLGCSAFIFGLIVGLTIGNIFYEIIVNVISLPFILLIFFIGWLPSIFQYTIQITRKKPQKNRTVKFLIRFIYPVGSIIFIFKSPLWGLGLSIIAGYLIMYIRNVKNKILKQVN